MNISTSSLKAGIGPKPKMVAIRAMDRAEGGPAYTVTINTDLVKDAGSTGMKTVAGAVSSVVHAPFSLAGPFLAPTGYERKDQHATVNGERWISVGTGLALGTVTQMMRGQDFVGALLAGGAIGAVAGAAGITVAQSLNGWKPILLDKIAAAKGKGAATTSGSEWRKTGGAYRMGYEAGFQESWRRGEEGISQVGELASGAVNKGLQAGKDAVKASTELADGFRNAGT